MAHASDFPRAPPQGSRKPASRSRRRRRRAASCCAGRCRGNCGNKAQRRPRLCARTRHAIRRNYREAHTRGEAGRGFLLEPLAAPLGFPDVPQVNAYDAIHFPEAPSNPDDGSSTPCFPTTLRVLVMGIIRIPRSRDAPPGGEPRRRASSSSAWACRSARRRLVVMRAPWIP